MYTNTLKNIEALFVTKSKKIGPSSSRHELLDLRVPFKQKNSCILDMGLSK
jgi:hypothetical protein